MEKENMLTKTAKELEDLQEYKVRILNLDDHMCQCFMNIHTTFYKYKL